MLPSFAKFMEQCLYENESGYYGSGKVEFAGEPHFWTYPRLLSPVFGWALAERVRQAVAAWTESHLLGESDTITILELGGGDGCLARDVLDYVVARESEHEWRRVSRRLEYVIAELSPALRARQELCLEGHIDAGRARVIDCDARHLSWDGPFKGVVFCNELISAFPVERLRIHDADGTISRVHVAHVPKSGDAPVAEERLVPVAEGWLNEDGIGVEPPRHLGEYLRSLSPLIADLAACDLLPVDLYWPPSLPEFVRSLSELLATAGNVVVALLVDYGGTSRHVLDPRSLGTHLRVYGADRELAHSNDAYAEPGSRDITGDVDFTEVARLARKCSLEVSFFGHQSAIETKDVCLDAAETLEPLAARLSRDVGYAPGVARLVAPQVVKRFRRSPCFWLMELAPHRLSFQNVMTSAETRPDGEALSTLARSVDREQLERELRQAGLPDGIAGRLKSCGDIAADLSDAGMLEHYHAVMRLLESHDWLRLPGAVCT